MKRTIIILSLLATVCGGLQAQTLSYYRYSELDTVATSRFTAVYRYEQMTLDAKGKAVTDTIQMALLVGDGVSRWYAYDRYLSEKLWSTKRVIHPINDCTYQETLMHVQSVWMGYPEGQMRTLEVVAPYCYEVIEDKQTPEWTLKEGATDSVCGYMCQEAIGEFRGLKWDVAYTEEIPSSAGPWKLCGLPGLILRAEDAEHHHRFTLVSLTQEERPITATKSYKIYTYDHTKNQGDLKNVSYIKISSKKLMEFKKRIFGNKQYPSHPSAHVPDPFTTFGYYFDTGKYKFTNGTILLDEAHVYQPLELK